MQPRLTGCNRPYGTRRFGEPFAGPEVGVVFDQIQLMSALESSVPQYDLAEPEAFMIALARRPVDVSNLQSSFHVITADCTAN